MVSLLRGLFNNIIAERIILFTFELILFDFLFDASEVACRSGTGLNRNRFHIIINGYIIIQSNQFDLSAIIETHNLLLNF